MYNKMLCRMQLIYFMHNVIV